MDDRCGQCGRVVPADAEDGLCPYCLANTVLGLIETHGIEEILGDGDAGGTPDLNEDPE